VGQGEEILLGMSITHIPLMAEINMGRGVVSNILTTAISVFFLFQADPD
jgi:hypothetical protein